MMRDEMGIDFMNMSQRARARQFLNDDERSYLIYSGDRPHTHLPPRTPPFDPVSDAHIIELHIARGSRAGGSYYPAIGRVQPPASVRGLLLLLRHSCTLLRTIISTSHHHEPARSSSSILTRGVDTDSCPA